MSKGGEWIRSPVKPLSMNQAYMGRKRKTVLYKRYEKALLALLPAMHVPEVGELVLHIRADFSNKRMDIDNCLKPFIDILQMQYNFNDNRIYCIIVKKNIVPKGEEGMFFKITEWKDDMLEITEEERRFLLTLLDAMKSYEEDWSCEEVNQAMEFLGELTPVYDDKQLELELNE